MNDMESSSAMPASPPWPESLSFPLLSSSSFSRTASADSTAGSSNSADNSSILSTSSAEAESSNARGIADAQSAARYFNNLRIASSDDDEPPGTPPNAIFRARWPQPPPVPKRSTNQNTIDQQQRQRNHSIHRAASAPSSHIRRSNTNTSTTCTSSSSSRLFIPFRPSRDYDDDNKHDAANESRRNNVQMSPLGSGGDYLTRSPFDPYGDASFAGGTVHRDCIPPFPILVNDDHDVPVPFPPIRSAVTSSTCRTSADADADVDVAAFDDPPLELSSPNISPRASSSSPAPNAFADPPHPSYSYSPPRTPRVAASMLQVPAPPPPVRRCHTYDEVHPAMHPSHLPKPTQTSTQGVLAVQGAELGNGIYKRTGRFDSAALYTLKTTHNGHPVTFTICRCVSSDFTRKWYLSIITPNSAKTSTCDALAPFARHDIDLYTAPGVDGGNADELPPAGGWRAVSGSGLGNIRTPHCMWVPMHHKEAATSPKRTVKKSSSSAPPGAPTTTRKVTQCCVCMDARVTTVFVPCGHAATCEDCSKQWKSRLTNGSRRRCPIGRCKVKGCIKLYATVVEDED